MEIEVTNTYPNGIFTLAQQKTLALAVSKILSNAKIESVNFEGGGDNNKKIS